MKLLTDTTNPEVIETIFNILHQETSRAFKKLKEKGSGLIAKIPLDSGWLAGEYNNLRIIDVNVSRWFKQNIETRTHLVERVKKIIQVNHNLAQKAIWFCLACGYLDIRM